MDIFSRPPRFSLRVAALLGATFRFWTTPVYGIASPFASTLFKLPPYNKPLSINWQWRSFRYIPLYFPHRWSAPSAGEQSHCSIQFDCVAILTVICIVLGDGHTKVAKLLSSIRYWEIGSSHRADTIPSHFPRSDRSQSPINNRPDDILRTDPNTLKPLWYRESIFHWSKVCFELTLVYNFCRRHNRNIKKAAFTIRPIHNERSDKLSS